MRITRVVGIGGYHDLPERLSMTAPKRRLTGCPEAQATLTGSGRA
jgi:hypothetical protein